jgi:glycosyltransferase involved in cell wall biosynthesis
MRYLMVSTYPPMRCGIGKYAYQMVQKMRQDGHIINIISPKEGGGDFACNLKGYANILTLLILSVPYDKVIFQYHQSFFFEDMIPRNFKSICLTQVSFYLVFLLLRKKIEIIIHELPQPSSHKYYYLMEKARWYLCPKLIFHTKKELENFELHYFKLPINKYELRSPSTYYHKFRDISTLDAKKELEIPRDKILLLCIGFIQPHKGFDRAIKAFSKIVNRKLELYVVGSLRIDNYDEYKDYLQDLKNMAKKSSSVHVIEEYLSDEGFDTWLSACDILIVPYRQIWSSAVIARAKLFGKPIIASDVGGLKDQLSESDISFKDDSELEYIFTRLSEYIS